MEWGPAVVQILPLLADHRIRRMWRGRPEAPTSPYDPAMNRCPTPVVPRTTPLADVRPPDPSHQKKRLSTARGTGSLHYQLPASHVVSQEKISNVSPYVCLSPTGSAPALREKGGVQTDTWP